MDRIESRTSRIAKSLGLRVLAMLVLLCHCAAASHVSAQARPPAPVTMVVCLAPFGAAGSKRARLVADLFPQLIKFSLLPFFDDLTFPADCADAPDGPYFQITGEVSESLDGISISGGLVGLPAGSAPPKRTININVSVDELERIESLADEAQSVAHDFLVYAREAESKWRRGMNVPDYLLVAVGCMANATGTAQLRAAGFDDGQLQWVHTEQVFRVAEELRQNRRLIVSIASDLQHCRDGDFAATELQRLGQVHDIVVTGTAEPGASSASSQDLVFRPTVVHFDRSARSSEPFPLFDTVMTVPRGQQDRLTHLAASGLEGFYRDLAEFIDGVIDRRTGGWRSDHARLAVRAPADTAIENVIALYNMGNDRLTAHLAGRLRRGESQSLVAIDAQYILARLAFDDGELGSAKRTIDGLLALFSRLRTSPSPTFPASQILRLDLREALLRQFRGNIRLRTGLVMEAVEDFKEALKAPALRHAFSPYPTSGPPDRLEKLGGLQEEALETQLLLGFALNVQGNYADAEPLFETLLSRNYKPSMSLNGLVETFAFRQQFDKAHELLQRYRPDLPNQADYAILERNFVRQLAYIARRHLQEENYAQYLSVAEKWAELLPSSLSYSEAANALATYAIDGQSEHLKPSADQQPTLGRLVALLDRAIASEEQKGPSLEILLNVVFKAETQFLRGEFAQSDATIKQLTIGERMDAVARLPDDAAREVRALGYFFDALASIEASPKDAPAEYDAPLKDLDALKQDLRNTRLWDWSAVRDVLEKKPRFQSSNLRARRDRLLGLISQANGQ